MIAERNERLGQGLGIEDSELRTSDHIKQDSTSVLAKGEREQSHSKTPRIFLRGNEPRKINDGQLKAQRRTKSVGVGGDGDGGGGGGGVTQSLKGKHQTNTGHIKEVFDSLAPCSVVLLPIPLVVAEALASSPRRPRRCSETAKTAPSLGVLNNRRSLFSHFISYFRRRRLDPVHRIARTRNQSARLLRTAPYFLGATQVFLFLRPLLIVLRFA